MDKRCQYWPYKSWKALDATRKTGIVSCDGGWNLIHFTSDICNGFNTEVWGYENWSSIGVCFLLWVEELLKRKINNWNFFVHNIFFLNHIWKFESPHFKLFAEWMNESINNLELLFKVCMAHWVCFHRFELNFCTWLFFRNVNIKSKSW